jgi:hypothetical protein
VRPPPPSSRRQREKGPELESFFQGERLSNYTGGPVDSLVPVRLVDMTDGDADEARSVRERRKRRLRGGLAIAAALGVGLVIGLSTHRPVGSAPRAASSGVSAEAVVAPLAVAPAAATVVAPAPAADGRSLVATAPSAPATVEPPATAPSAPRGGDETKVPAAHHGTPPPQATSARVESAAAKAGSATAAPPPVTAGAARVRRGPRKAAPVVNPPTANFPD